MMVWLDTATDKKAHPNENFAREMMELFTLGIGNYSQDDVTAAARAFTGWVYDRVGYQYAFRPRQHDFGTKTYLGQSGDWNGDDVVHIAVQPRGVGAIRTGQVVEPLRLPGRPVRPGGHRPVARLRVGSGHRCRPSSHLPAPGVPRRRNENRAGQAAHRVPGGCRPGSRSRRLPAVQTCDRSGGGLHGPRSGREPARRPQAFPALLPPWDRRRSTLRTSEDGAKMPTGSTLRPHSGASKPPWSWRAGRT